MKTDWNTVEPSKDFRYGAPTVGNSHGGFSIVVDVVDKANGGTKPLMFQTPVMSLPFGLSEKKRPNNANNSVQHVAGLQFTNVKHDPSSGTWHGDEEMLKFFNFIRSVEKNNIEKAHESCKTIFKKSYDESFLENIYYRAVFESEKVLSGEYSPIFQCKVLANRKGGFDTQFFEIGDDNHAREIPYEMVGRRRRAVALVEARRIWFANNNFGMSFNVRKIFVYKENHFEGVDIDLPGVIVDKTPMKQPEGESKEIVFNGLGGIDVDADVDEEPSAKRQKGNDASQET